VRIFDPVCFHAIKLTAFSRASKPPHGNDHFVRLRIAARRAGAWRRRDCGLRIQFCGCHV
jgi:hypothetical protein